MSGTECEVGPFAESIPAIIATNLHTYIYKPLPVGLFS